MIMGRVPLKNHRNEAQHGPPVNPPLQGFLSTRFLSKPFQNPGQKTQMRVHPVTTSDVQEVVKASPAVALHSNRGF
jgi:hypothetical protein